MLSQKPKSKKIPRYNSIPNKLHRKEKLMEKIRARIFLSEEENAQKVLVAFFKKLYPGNSIYVENGIVSIEGIFDDTWIEIAEAVGSYKKIEFYYGEEPTGERNSEAVEYATEGKEGEAQITVLAEGAGGSHNEENVCRGIKEEEKAKSRGESPKDNEQLEKIAQESGSFEELLDKIVMWLGIEKRRDIFAAIVRVARDTKKATWNEIENNLMAQGISMSPYDKRDIANAIRQKTGATVARDFIKAVAEYQTFDFSTHQINDEVGECAELEELGIFTGIPEIEEALQTLQANWSLPEKVAHILKAIGLEVGISEQDGIVDQLIRALQAEDGSDLKNIGDLAEFLGKDMFEVLQYSDSLNGALKNKGYPVVKITDFIKGLREVL